MVPTIAKKKSTPVFVALVTAIVLLSGGLFVFHSHSEQTTSTCILCSLGHSLILPTAGDLSTVVITVAERLAIAEIENTYQSVCVSLSEQRAPPALSILT